MSGSPESSSTRGQGASKAALLPGAQFGSAGQCLLALDATTDLGPDAGKTLQGTLTLAIGQDGAIDSGTLELSDGTTQPVVGQANGRSIRLRIGSGPDAVMTFIGSAMTPLDQCAGPVTGAFTGPGLENIGVWSATASSGA